MRRIAVARGPSRRAHEEAEAMARPGRLARLGGVLGLLGLWAGTAVAQSAVPPAERGRYLATIMDCGGCHTDGALAGKPDPARHLAGSGIGFGFPGGVVYPSNLTPDPDTGLGRWSEAELVQAIRRGVRPDGRTLVPIMPWPAYAVMTDDDVRALVAYLRSLPAVRHQVPQNAGPGDKPPAPYLTVVVP